MKINSLFVLLIIGLIFLLGCGKPNEAESLYPDNITGGYTIVKKLQTSGYAQDVIKSGNLLYLAQGEGGLEIINIDDPLNPYVVSTTTDGARGYSAKIAKKDSAIYLAAGSFGVTVINVANPYDPVVTMANSAIKPAKNLFVIYNYLFTPISELGITVADISFPVQLENRGNTRTSGFAQDVVATTDTTLMVVACGEMGLSIFNISDFQDGWGIYPQIGWCDTPGYAEAVAIKEDESIAFMACGTSGLQIVDYSDTTNIHIVGSYDGSGYAKEILYKDQKVFMTTELSGLQILNVSNITSPSLVGIVDTEFAMGIDIDEQYIYLADEDEGLIIISIP